MPQAEHLNRYLPASVQRRLEQTYYARINADAQLEAALNDPSFYRDPSAHLALFNDHGVVHVRDVAQQILTVLEHAHGRLIARRAPERLNGFMKSYGVLVAYLHDIGMIDCSPFGRAMHPEFAAQAVFDPAFEPLLETIWQSDCGGIASRLRNLAEVGALAQEPRLALRELLALTNCHSKSKVPAPLLNNRTLLRAHMQQTIGADLAVLYARYQVERARRALAAAQERPAAERIALVDRLHQAEAALAVADPTGERAAACRAALERHYADFDRDAFGWLVAADPAVRALADDVVDTLRALRCADALRQRGAVLKTSGGYEIFVDQTSADALFALRRGADQLLLAVLHVPIAAGEANIADSVLNHAGNLRIAFHRGAFVSSEVVQRAAAYAACAVNDIQADVIDSFQPPDVHGEDAARSELQIVLEETADNPAFAGLVREQLYALSPHLRGRVQLAPCSRPALLAAAPSSEDVRYAAATELPWSRAERDAAAVRIARGGHNMAAVDLDAAFAQVRLAQIGAGEMLVEAGADARYVYIPLSAGLMIVPLGGYCPFAAPAWLPIGTTAVIRGAQRNAGVYAVRALTLLMIPQDVYLSAWHRPYRRAELIARLEQQRG
jgi:hypothetical protein